MAHRIVTQVLVTGARVFGRAFAEAYKQASASQKYQQSVQGGTASNTLSSAGLTLDEACRILNVPPPKQGQADLEKVHNNFKRLFDTNDPKKGGSFYLQSKVLRARERLELEAQRLRAQSAEKPPEPPKEPPSS
ncbi:putative mitochondrial import inner membrane translocase subunit Tim16 [Septoria linicola]|nr:putative mitochondrial import inner membrane translocase subunit Tim16 [Septoria linicola]